MRFALLHRHVPGTGPQEGTPEHDAEMARWAALEQELRSTGVGVGSYALQPGDPIVVGAGAGAAPTDPEPVLFAVHVLEVPDADAAVDWVGRMPTVAHGTVEVRPLMA